MVINDALPIERGWLYLWAPHPLAEDGLLLGPVPPLRSRGRSSVDPSGRRKGRRRPSRCPPRADISRRRGLPASFLARRITSRCCHTPVPGAGLRLGGAGAHGGCARRGQPGLCRPPALFEVSGAGCGARGRERGPGSLNPPPTAPGAPRPQGPERRRGGGREGGSGCSG